MKHLAHKNEHHQPVLEYGRVVSQTNGTFVVQTDYGRADAVQAMGCLIRPGKGDKVLLSLDGSENGYILSVLEREPTDERIDMDFQGNVCLNVRQGDFVVQSDRDISLISNEQLHCASDEISFSARHGKAFVDTMSLVGHAVSTQVERITAVALNVEHTFRRFTQRLENAFRFIKDHEEVQTKSTRYLVDDLMAVHTKNTDLTSEEIVKINAEQIHLG
jgi:hypothetical protein